MKNPKVMSQINDLEKSMKYSLDLKRNNAIMAEIIYSMMDKLKQHGEDHISFLYEGTPDVYDFDELEQALKDLKMENFI